LTELTNKLLDTFLILG